MFVTFPITLVAMCMTYNSPDFLNLYKFLDDRGKHKHTSDLPHKAGCHCFGLHTFIVTN